MNAELRNRLARLDTGRRRVRLATRLVAFGATALAVVAGVAFAQQPSHTSVPTGGATSGTGGSTNSDTNGGTNSGTNGGSGSGPSVTVPDPGFAPHTSSGGS